MTMKDQSPADSRFFRDVLGNCSTAVTIITAPSPDDGPHAGMTVGSFLSVSLDPPLVAFLPDKSSTTWPRIEQAGKFCANILRQDQIDLCKRFTSRDIVDRFEGLDHRISENGSPVLADCIAFVDCDIEDVHEAGDHHIVIGRVRELAAEEGENPLLFFKGRYHALQPIDGI